jgi:small GTP-binding protein
MVGAVAKMTEYVSPWGTSYKWIGVLLARDCSELLIQYNRVDDYKKVLKSLRPTATLLLLSTGKTVNENENEWQVLNQITQCKWSRELTQARSPEERDAIWTQTFTKEPLKDIAPKHRWNFVGVTEICRQVCAMRRILARQPPKVVITGQSQTGKSTLFSYLTRRNMEELRSNTNSNTRMSLQCQAFIKLHDESSERTILVDSELPINVIDNPGYNDATDQSETLLNISITAANLVILVTTLEDINQIHTIALLRKILDDTRVKVLVLINKVDLGLSNAREKIKKANSNNYIDSDENDSGSDESGQRFSLCKTLDELIKRPQEELIQELTMDRSIVNSRVTFQPVILKGFNELIKTLNEIGFRDKVHKSNINKWIQRNLINTKDSNYV